MKKRDGYVYKDQWKNFWREKESPLHVFRERLNKPQDVMQKIILSPVGQDKEPFVPQDKPDYEVMIGDLIYLRERCSNLSQPKLQRVIDFLILQTKHTPQATEDKCDPKPERKQDELRARPVPPIDYPPEKEKR